MPGLTAGRGDNGLERIPLIKRLGATTRWQCRRPRRGPPDTRLGIRREGGREVGFCPDSER